MAQLFIDKIILIKTLRFFGRLLGNLNIKSCQYTLGIGQYSAGGNPTRVIGLSLKDSKECVERLISKDLF